MDPKFLSSEFLYNGEYQGIIRNPDCETDKGLHYHDFYEIQFYFSNVEIMRIENKNYHLHKGDIVFIDIFTPHALSYESDVQYERFCLSINPSILLMASSSNSNLLNLFSHENSHYPVTHLKNDDFKKIISIFYEYEQCNLKHGKDIFERALLYRALAELYNLFFDGTYLDPSRSQYVIVVAKLIRFINEHLSEDLSLELLADQVNFSPYHVCRIFKKYTCSTLTHYIVSKRIETAKFLLRSSDTISNISHKVGFNNYSYFYKVFKEHTRYSPTEYRKLIMCGKTTQNKHESFTKPYSITLS